MIVFSNTTPFIALSSIDKLDLLPLLFSELCVVPEVVEECSVGGSVEVPDLSGLPWINVVPSTAYIHSHFLLELDKGEKYTIHAACTSKANLVIIDEKIGRNIAEYMGLSVIGHLGGFVKCQTKRSD